MNWFDNFRRIILLNPMSAFVWSILSKWYIMVICASLVVVFWTFKGLQKAGVLSKFEAVVSQALNDTKAMAKYCVPLITSPIKFWECAQNTKPYEETEQAEKDLDKTEKEYDKLFDNRFMHDFTHPYENEDQEQNNK